MITSLLGQLNWIDYLIFFVMIFYLWEGSKRGFILGCIDLLGFILSFFGAMLFYNKIATFLTSNWEISLSYARAIAFLLFAVLSEFIFTIGVRVVFQIIAKPIAQRVLKSQQITLAKKLNFWGGLIPSLFEGFVFLSFVLTLILALPVSPVLKKDITSSVSATPLIANTRLLEHELSGVFGPAVSDTLTFLTINPDTSSTETIHLGFTQPEYTIDEEAENAMLAMVNNERVKVGLGPLESNVSLRNLARLYARDMFEKGYFSHTDTLGRSPFDRMTNAGIRYEAAGENLALAPSVQIAHEGLMNSPGHKANILSKDFGKVGIGVIDGGVYGQMFVQEFTN